MNLTISELAHAVSKNETYVRQHIHRKHLLVQKDGRNVSVTLDEAVRWARERGLSFVSPIRASMTTGDLKDRTARMTVLTWQAPGTQPYNLFTLIRHRRQDALGPWAGESDKTWSIDDLGHELRLFSLDASFECCQTLVNQVLDTGTLEIDGLEIQYALEPNPRRHWAYRRDDRLLCDASMCSPFLKHSAEIIEYWSFRTEPHKRWLEVIESLQGNAPPRLAHLGFPLDRRPDRVGNLMITGAEDAIACNLTRRNQTLMLQADANDLLPDAYRATVWASHSGDEVLRREVQVTLDETEIKLASDVDHIGFAIYRTVDGQCVDLMEGVPFRGINVIAEIESGPVMHLQDRRGRLIHKVKSSGSISTIKVPSDNDSAELDKGIRRLWLDRRVHQREADARREGNLARFGPDEFNKTVQYFIGLLGQDSEQKEPIYLADRYFMDRLKGDKGTKLYLKIFEATTGRPLRILCTERENGNVRPWWSNYPNQITTHVTVRAFLKSDKCTPKFHDRYLITPRREFLITNSLKGWPKSGVTFAGLPYGIYRAEAEQLWSMGIGSSTTDIFVHEIFDGQQQHT